MMMDPSHGDGVVHFGDEADKGQKQRILRDLGGCDACRRVTAVAGRDACWQEPRRARRASPGHTPALQVWCCMSVCMQHGLPVGEREWAGGRGIEIGMWCV
jgi:hypothetical protein